VAEYGELRDIMILTAHQPQYLPGLRLFDKIARADVFVYLDTVPMESSGYENRNKIKTAQGWQWLTVPISRKGYQGKMVREIEIDYTQQNWQKKHRKAIEFAYGKAPWFEWFPKFLFEWLYTERFQLLTTLNGHMICILLDALGIKTEFRWANVDEFQGHKSDLVLDMCKKLGATKYIFGVKGRDYAKVEDFERAGIELEFQDYQHPVYPQLHGEFLPNMSVVDLLMNCGPKSLQVLTCGNLKK